MFQERKSEVGVMTLREDGMMCVVKVGQRDDVCGQGR